MTTRKRHWQGNELHEVCNMKSQVSVPLATNADTKKKEMER